MLVWGEADSETSPKRSIRRKLFKTCCMNWGEVNPTHAYYNGSCIIKDIEDSSWSTSFKTRRTQKKSSALKALWKTLFYSHHQTKRKYNNTSNSNDEKPNKRVCKAEKFEAIKYSLGPNEEYIAITRCEYDTWKRNEDSMSKIYQEIFQEKENGWKDLAEKKSTKLVKDLQSGNVESVGVLKLQDGCSTHILLNKLNLKNLPSKISGEFLILILYNSCF
ncbi:hypothetical protein Tco_0732959 [Tanacetum coccineum]